MPIKQTNLWLVTSHFGQTAPFCLNGQFLTKINSEVDQTSCRLSEVWLADVGGISLNASLRVTAVCRTCLVLSGSPHCGFTLSEYISFSVIPRCVCVCVCVSQSYTSWQPFSLCSPFDLKCPYRSVGASCAYACMCVGVFLALCLLF